MDLGFDVTVISTPRAYVACEGVSARVMGAFKQLGFEHALATLAAPSQRTVEWNGERSQANWEQLVRRDQLDAALQLDLKKAGVRLLDAKVGPVNETACGISLQYQNPHGSDKETASVLTADFFIDARGRNAPGAAQQRMRGPETLGLLQSWQGEPEQARSEIVSFDSGWIWLARFGDGSRYTQLSLAAEKIPPRQQLSDFFGSVLAQCPAAQAYTENATQTHELTARSATAMLTAEPVSSHSIRIGDAAMAVDPLSGNGIFQALSTGLIAPAIVNTLLHRSNNAELAKQFYRERVHHAFMRFARLGRDFYQQEQSWPDAAFWQPRQLWPDQVPMHEPPRPDRVLVETRPVVCDHFIEAREVVVTPDQPLGVWHLEGVVLAPMVRRLLAEPGTPLTPAWYQSMGVFDVVRQQALTGWFTQQGMVSPG
ncbi:MAG: hypothetical protein Aseana_06390 [Candidatus Pelagadaptatus aseana]